VYPFSNLDVKSHNITIVRKYVLLRQASICSSSTVSRDERVSRRNPGIDNATTATDHSSALLSRSSIGVSTTRNILMIMTSSSASSVSEVEDPIGAELDAEISSLKSQSKQSAPLLPLFSKSLTNSSINPQIPARAPGAPYPLLSHHPRHPLTTPRLQTRASLLIIQLHLLRASRRLPSPPNILPAACAQPREPLPSMRQHHDISDPGP